MSDSEKVAAYLVRQFANSPAPFYRDVGNAERALKAIEADQRRAIRLGDAVIAAKLGRDIVTLQQVIRAHKPVVNVRVPVRTFINGREIGAEPARFRASRRERLQRWLRRTFLRQS